MAMLFIPILFGMSKLYIWAQPGDVAADPVSLKTSTGISIRPVSSVRAIDLFRDLAGARAIC